MNPINKKKFIKFQEAWGPHFLDRKVCTTFLAGLLGTNKVCPGCKLSLNNTAKLRIESGKRATCPECNLRFSYRTATVLERSGLSAEKVCLFMLLGVLEEGSSWSTPGSALSRTGQGDFIRHHPDRDAEGFAGSALHPAAAARDVCEGSRRAALGLRSCLGTRR